MKDKKNLSSQKINTFLKKIDSYFPVPLSQKQDLELFSQKLFEKATLALKWEENEIVAMVAGYTENLCNELAYISVVATVKEAQGRGYSKENILEFLEICKDKGIKAVHLYTTKNNMPAIKLYKKIGFVEYIQENEPRKEDLHLIYYLKQRIK